MDYNIGKTISALRKQKGWTQVVLAEKLGVSDKAVSKWESGGGYPEVSQLPVLAKIFNVSIDYILTGEDFTPVVQPDAQPADESVVTIVKEEKSTMKIRDFILKLIKDVCLLLLGLGLAACGLMGAWLQPSNTVGYFEFAQLALLMSGAAVTIIGCIRIAETVLKHRDAK